jgi:hypothetical protein
MGGTGTVVRSSYAARAERLAVSSRMAKSAASLRLKARWRLYRCDTPLKRLAQDLEDMAVELGEFIQEAHALVRQRHFPGHRHLPATDLLHGHTPPAEAQGDPPRDAAPLLTASPTMREGRKHCRIAHLPPLEPHGV